MHPCMHRMLIALVARKCNCGLRLKTGFADGVAFAIVRCIDDFGIGLYSYSLQLVVDAVAVAVAKMQIHLCKLNPDRTMAIFNIFMAD